MQRQRLLGSIYSASFFFTLHYAFLLYIGSSYLSQYFTADIAERAVSIIYVVASLLAVYATLKTPALFRAIGLLKTARLYLIITALTSALLAITKSGWIAVPLFILLSIAHVVVRYVLDIYIETFSTEEMTGRLRAVFLTVINTAIAISPLLVGFLIAETGFPVVYFVSAVLVLIALFFADGKLEKIKDHNYHDAAIVRTARKIFRRPNIYKIFAANFILELFYAWMVIYTPLYLTQNLGFSWGDIGIIFSIMLIPFILFEIPAGYIADTRLGEKEILTLGLVIMGLSTISLAYISSSTIMVWASVLFVTRIGASLVEIMVDTYFFKKVHPEDTDIIAFFRNARPMATLIAPLLGAAILAAGTYQTLYLILGLICILGTRYSLSIQDTR